MNTRLMAGLSFALLLALPISAVGQQPTARPAPAATYTDAQLSAYANASQELAELAQGRESAQGGQLEMTPEAAAILERHNLDVTTYNAIAERARNDRELAARIGRLGSDFRYTP
jgi:hypothetical protein